MEEFDLDTHLASLPRKPYTGGFTKENIDKELQEHPAFATPELDENGQLPTLVEALQQLKYDPAENTADELAESYKEDGNYNFKLKKYKWAVDSYSEGLKQKCTNNGLVSVLYSNRATANFYIGNYRSAINDCKESLKFNPFNLKAIIRGANSANKLEVPDETLEWCDKGLEIESSNAGLLELVTSARKQKQIQGRAARQKIKEQRKMAEEDVKLRKEIEDRKITLSSTDLKPLHMALEQCTVHLDSSTRSLVWPVMFLYPEYEETDIVQNFNENDLFSDHLLLMFGKTTPEWDKNGHYSYSNLEVYYTTGNGLIQVSLDTSLKRVLSNSKYVVCGGTPTFVVLSQCGAFKEEFAQRYKKGYNLNVKASSE